MMHPAFNGEPGPAWGVSTDAGQQSEVALWPPPRCTGTKPAPPPIVASGRGGRRGLRSEAPTELVLQKRPPDQGLKERVYTYLMEFMASETSCSPTTCSRLATGSVVNRTRPPLFPDPCTLLTANPDCAADTPTSGVQRLPPALGVGSLGRCAFIGTGVQVLQHAFGKEIDAHDTVVRYNTPIKGYEKYVGTKTSLVWAKAHYKTTAKPSMGYFPCKGGVCKGTIYGIKNLGGLRTLRNELTNMWLASRKIKEGKPAAGILRTILLIKSGLCTDISLYGFSTSGTKGRTGKYFDKRALVTKGHTIDWDGWILAAMMDMGYICVYGL
ncbi:hypothetical protein CYMTET_17700 [Cymbomonas tetramitiformis]|uniref:beta-galactoside alpha-(2,6)-sialyltransferase n=1 Tax=Cymbomonas tetramitiformis TaxID=36881 RepID=A0AAE0G9F2_9CHLO|nr:hypothetical protein CYMTET_17700 [Cymbomonas tetramitiformis]